MAKRKMKWWSRRSNTDVQKSDLKNPAGWFMDWLFGDKTASGKRVSNGDSIINSNIYTVCSVLGGDIGKLPVQVFRKRGGKISKDTDHPVSYLLGTRSNPLMSAYTFKELSMVHLATWGNFYANIEWDEMGLPKALWPLNPAQTDVKIDWTSNEIWYITTLPNGVQRKLHMSDVLHLKLISTTGLKGMSPIAALREKLGSQNAMERFTSSFYENGTSIGGILKTEQKIDKPAKERTREEWNRLHTGLNNAHRIAVLDAGLDYKSIGMPLKDAEFIETQKFGISEVAKLYKIPPHKLGLLDKATFSNIEHQSIEYVKNTLQPHITNWEQEANFKLFTQNGARDKGRYARFNVTSELRGDSQSRAAYYKEMIQMGVYSINEVRELEERDNIGEMGDKHLIPLNFTTLDKLEQVQTGVDPAKGGEGTEPDKDEGLGQASTDQQSGSADGG
ncbi:phage portal protein [Paenibacillus polymyxa]|uniref:Phage portal protein n=1 Tax=Paenibacillus polymyxa TaxID=1406 RepID=A0AAP4A758_PAEPO|nr:phage portal protein [Paenibacillus polymyxa]MDH2334275.1 phage portal protein [Paenibacillus polymyxa]